MRTVKYLLLIGFVIAVCRSNAQSNGDSSLFQHYEKEIGYLLKNQFYIISKDGKPDSIYKMPYQGIIMNYQKKENYKTRSYIRDIQYFFNYTNAPNSNVLIDTCCDVIIEEPENESRGWIEYFDKKYPKEIITNGEDNLGSLGCEKEWDYTKNVRICLSRYKGKVTIQVNFKLTGSM